jgi:hypothetical protein
MTSRKNRNRNFSETTGEQEESMKGKQVGIGLVVIGSGLVIWGFQVAGTFSAKVAKVFGSAPPTEAMLLWIGGAALIAVGLLQLLRK